MYGRERNLIVEALLFCLSLLYGVLVRARLSLYRLGLFRTLRLPVRVISVGNITLGGTGKTPTVIHLAEVFRGGGKRPAVVSRGYGRRNEGEIAVVTDGSGARLGPDEAGDEPAMIASCCAGVPVVVGSDRWRAGLLAIDRFHPDVVILDDGFQHVRLHRDLNIVLVDGADPFGNGRLFPAGILREPLGQLGRADVVLITRASAAADLASLKERISRYTAADILTSNVVPRDLVNLATGAAFPLEGLRGSAVIAAAGIGRPGSFRSLLESLGAEVRDLKAFPDHHRYGPPDLEELRRLATDRGAGMIVTTEKDAVKLAGTTRDDLWMLRIRLEVVEKERWERVLWGP